MTKHRPIVITDHAVLRWLERAAGLDIAALRRSIGHCADVGRAHGARIVVIEGVKLVLSADLARVVTVLRRDQPHSDIVTLTLDRTIPLVRRPKRRKR